MANRSYSSRVLRRAGWVTLCYFGAVLGCIGILSTAEKLLGCRFDESAAHACMVAGADIGGALYSLGMVAVAGAFLFPLFLIVMIVGLIGACLARPAR